MHVILLLSLVRRVHRQITEADDQESKHSAPTTGKNNCCPNCNINHEARDFVRALLLRVIDIFETSDGYLRFLAENEHVSRDYIQVDQTETETWSKLKSEVEIRNRQLATGTTVLRILSIEKDPTKDQLSFFAINKDRVFLCGTIDKNLVTDAMSPDSMIECLTNDIVMDTEIGSYIGLSKQTNDYVRVLPDDPSFPKIRDLISKAETIIRPDQENNRKYILEGVIIQDPLQVKLGKDQIRTRVLLRDDTGIIRVNLSERQLNKFVKGDKILVIDGLRHEWNTIDEGYYGSVIKTGAVDLTDPANAFPNDVYFKHLNVDKTTTQNGINVILHAVDFTPFYTRDFLTNDNASDKELSFILDDNIAVQNKRQYTTTYGQPYKGINNKIPPGIEETGIISFEPLDPTKPMASFRFRVRHGVRNIDFTFTIYIPN